MVQIKDVCTWCEKKIRIPQDVGRTILGEKTQSVWYLCKRCNQLVVEGLGPITRLVEYEDEQLFEETKVKL